MLQDQLSPENVLRAVKGGTAMYIRPDWHSHIITLLRFTWEDLM
jgi:hypothetical protein